MFEAEESVESILETIAPWVEQLEPLQRQLEVQDAVARPGATGGALSRSTLA